MKFRFIKSKQSELPYNTFAEYYIGPEVDAIGDCKTDQDIYIDGNFKGTINTTGLVELAKNSKVSADIKARTAIIEGVFNGNAQISDELHATSCSTLYGNLEAANIIVDKGSILKAKVSMERN